MVPIYEHRPELADVETRAIEVEGEGPPLLLLHGFADSADSWRLVLDELRRRRRAAVALDCPGFGSASTLSHDGPVVPQLDAFVEAAVRRFAGPEGIVIVGNSLGGVLAIRAAQREHLPVRGVVPIAPAGLEMPTWFQVIQGEPIMRTLLSTPMPVPEIAVREVVGRLYRVLAFSSPRRVDDRLVDAFTTHIRTKEDAARILATGRRLLPELGDPFELDRISCPVQLVWGDRDRMVKITGAERVLREVPHARMETLEGVGHCPQVEVPERIAGIVSDFAQRLEGNVVRAGS
jgi:pimeloyl-ACP methyl ester carboxylesterase